MTILDANVLLYAYDLNSPHYPETAGWVERLFRSDERIAIPWVTMWAFIRVRTNPRLGAHARTLEETMSIIREWIAHPNVMVLEPGSRHVALLEDMIASGQATGSLVTDSVLAALAMEYGAALASTDRDFARFPGLRWVNPLA